MVEQSATIAKLAAAMVAVQSEVANPVKDKTNPHFKSRYASLEAVYDVARAVLAKYKLAVVQVPTEGATGPALATTVFHESGEYLRSVAPLLNAKSDPQSVGSAVTYARRYALLSILGITAEDDDDGNAAGNQQQKQAAPARQQHQQAPARQQQSQGYSDKEMDAVLARFNLTWQMVVAYINKKKQTKYRDGTEIPEETIQKFFVWLDSQPAGTKLAA